MLCGNPPSAIMLAAGLRALFRAPRGEEVGFMEWTIGGSVMERICGNRGLAVRAVAEGLTDISGVSSKFEELSLSAPGEGWSSRGSIVW